MDLDLALLLLVAVVGAGFFVLGVAIRNVADDRAADSRHLWAAVDECVDRADALARRAAELEGGLARLDAAHRNLLAVLAAYTETWSGDGQ